MAILWGCPSCGHGNPLTSPICQGLNGGCNMTKDAFERMGGHDRPRRMTMLPITEKPKPKGESK